MAGFGGVSQPDNLGNAHITENFQRFGAVSDARVIDIDLQNSVAFGAKVGYFFESRKWLGLEAEVFRTNPFVKQQIVIVGSPTTNGGNTFAQTIPGAHLTLTTMALNILTRDTSIDSFQAYGGVGIALFYAESRDFPGAQVRPGLNVLAGGRYFLSDRFAPFGEFKFDTATIKFDGIKGNFSAQTVVFGLSYFFR